MQPSFAEVLRDARIRAGFSQDMLAELAAMSVQAISALERGARTRPYKDTVARLVGALELDAEARVSFEAAAQGKPRVRGASSISAHPFAVELFPLVGRDDVVRDICQTLLSGERLVSIVGTGGVGKTAVARAVNAQLHCRQCDGHAFIDLQDAVCAAGLFNAIAAALRISAGADAFEALVQMLESSRMLLVLDSFDRAIDAAPRLAHLLQRCHGLSVLVTSREALHLRGETVFGLEPLDAEGARALFVQIAQRANREFHVGAQDRDLETVLGRLDGLPLAIELAAARLSSLTLADLQAACAAPLDLLTHNFQDAPSRHATMESAIGWSYGSLTPAQQRAFAQLSSLPAGCHEEAILAACGGNPGEARLAIGALVEKHFLTRTVSESGETCVQILPLLREFGERAAGEEARREACNVHAQWYAAYVAQGAAHLGGTSQRLWLRRLHDALPNIRRANYWLVERRDGARALDLALDLCEYYSRTGQLDEARMRLETALAIAQSGAPAGTRRHDALTACGRLAQLQGDFDAAARCFEEAGADFDHSLLHALAAGGDLDPELTEYENSGDDLEMRYRLVCVADLAMRSGDDREALAYYTAALESARVYGDESFESIAAAGVAACFARSGDTAGAMHLFDDALRSARDLQNPLAAARALHGIAEIQLQRGDLDRAASALWEALLMVQISGARPPAADLLFCAARICSYARRANCAVEFCAAALACTAALALAPPRGWDLERAQIVAAATARLSKANCEAHWNRGTAAAFDAVVAAREALAALTKGSVSKSMVQ